MYIKDCFQRHNNCGYRKRFDEFFAGFVIFSVVGHVAHLKNITVTYLSDVEGSGMAFTIYPMALAGLYPVPGPFFSSSCWFSWALTVRYSEIPH